MSYNPATNNYDYNAGSHPLYEPNGTIKIYRDVPLDATYTHTFNSNLGNLQNQLESGGSDSYLKYTLNAQSYSRLTEGSVRVEIFKGDLISCNYMQITNGINGENFPYWCFITDVEYVNNKTSDIYFQIDYLQTFWTHFTIPANFIEREHCVKSEDKVGANLVPETLEVGDYLINGYEHLNDYASGSKIVVMYIPNLPAGEGAKPYLLPDGTVTGLEPDHFYDCNERNGFGKAPACVVLNDNTNLNIAVGNLINAHNTIVAIYQIGNEMYLDNFYSASYSGHSFTFNEGTTFKRTNGTTYSNVRNKKLYNYPFRQLIISNNNGQNAEYKWEFFETESQGTKQAQLSRGNVMLPTPCSFVFPKYYRGKAYDYENRVVIDDFPQVNWSEDSFSKWWAQNKANWGISLATQGLSTGIMLATGGGAKVAGGLGTMTGLFADEGAIALENMANANLAGMGSLGRSFGSMANTFFQAEEMSKSGGGSGRKGLSRSHGIALSMGAQGVARSLGQIQQAKATPDTANIQKNNALVNILVGNFGFTLYDMGITGEMAEIIDKYFDMFGYATHKVKLPNFTTSSTARSAYNYIKMQNCCILAQTGDRGLPNSAQEAIQKIFNNGITIWRRLSDIGNYGINND